MATVTKELIQEGIAKNPLWAQRALEVIYNFQTQDEKSAQTTKVVNGVGFTAYDAPLLSDLGLKLKKAKARGTEHPDWEEFGLHGLYLSRKQLALAAKYLTKYWKQLLNATAKKEVSD